MDAIQALDFEFREVACRDVTRNSDRPHHGTAVVAYREHPCLDPAHLTIRAHDAKLHSSRGGQFVHDPLLIRERELSILGMQILRPDPRVLEELSGRATPDAFVTWADVDELGETGSGYEKYVLDVFRQLTEALLAST